MSITPTPTPTVTYIPLPPSGGDAGRLWLWGNNQYGQIGDNTVIYRSSPVQTVAGGTDWHSISAGDNHTLAIKDNGSLWAWGWNAYGQLGNSSVTNLSSPVQIGLNTDWLQVSAGYNFSTALKNDGTIWSWGANDQGQLGSNNTSNISSPIQIYNTGTFNWIHISAGYSHASAITEDGRLWSWGSNSYGEAGIGSYTTPIVSYSENAAGGYDWRQVACGTYFTLAIKSDGKVWGWGKNTNGQFGDSSNTSRNSPVLAIGNGELFSISAGQSFAGALGFLPTPEPTASPGPTATPEPTPTPSGTGPTPTPSPSPTPTLPPLYYLKLWGANNSGQLGDNTTTNRSSPVQTIVGGDYWSDVNLGDYASFAIKTDNSLWVWGRNFIGALGDNTIVHRSSPVQTVAGGTNWQQAAVGTYGAAVKSDNSLWMWGTNNIGELGDNTTVAKSSPIQIGGFEWDYVDNGWQFHTAAIKTDGTLWLWGNNYLGQLGDNTSIQRSSPVQIIGGGTNWSTVAVGLYHTAAIKNDGTLWTWGYGFYGQLGNDDRITLSSPVQTASGGTDWDTVATGAFSTVATKTDGTLWCWGLNSADQLGLGPSGPVYVSSPVQTYIYGTTWKQVQIGYNHTLAVKTDGTLWVWGRNSFGQLGTGNITCLDTPKQIIDPGFYWEKVSAGYDHSAGLGYFVATPTPTVTPSPTPTSATPTPTISPTPTPTGPTPTASPSATPSPTPSPSVTPSPTPSPSPSLTPSPTPSITPSPTPSATPSPSTAYRLFTWGSNYYGSLGDNTILSKSSPVQIIGNGTTWSDIDAGTNFSIAKKTDGTAWLWGLQTFGNLGDNSSASTSSPIQTISAGFNWSSVHEGAGSYAAAAIKNDNSLWVWGYNASGQLGDNTLVAKSSPIQLLGSWASVAAGWYNTMGGIKTDGTLWTWGLNDVGQLGDGSLAASKSSPVQIYGGGTDWDKISGGQRHFAAIKNDGSLWLWGLNYSGQLGTNNTVDSTSPIEVLTSGTWDYVSCGFENTCAIKTDGTLWCWGSNQFGQLGAPGPSQPSYSSPVQVSGGGSNWKQVSTGTRHTLAVKTDGTLWSWGLNSYGELGDNTTIQKWAPVQVGNASFLWEKVVAGAFHSIALGNIAPAPTPTATPVPTPLPTIPFGYLYLWGVNADGQLAQNNTTNTNYPVEVFGDSNTWALIDAGEYSFSALKNDGSLWLWGDNSYGQLADGSIADKSSPVMIGSPSDGWTVVSIGKNFGGGINMKYPSPTPSPTISPTPTPTPSESAANTPTPTLSPTLSPSPTPSESPTSTPAPTDPTPTPTPSASPIISPTPMVSVTVTPTPPPVTTTPSVTVSPTPTPTGVALDAFYTVGSNTNAQLAIGLAVNRSSPIQTITGGTNWSAVAYNTNTTIGIKSDGTIWSWGYNSYGQLGSGTRLHRSSPAQVVGNSTDWSKVTIGIYHASAIKTDGTLWSWGANQYGKLGDNTTTHKSSPVQVVGGGTDWSQVSSTNYHVGAIKKDGSLWLWGLNSDGQLGTNDILHRSSPIQTVSGGTDWTQVACGTYHTAAIKTDGTLWVWGDNTSWGALGTGNRTSVSSPVQTVTGGTTWSQVSAGASYTAAVKSDGTLWTWGRNFLYGHLGINTTNSISSPLQVIGSSVDWQKVACGESSTAAIKKDGTLWVWGFNGNGKLGDNTTSSKSSPVQIYGGGSNWLDISAGGTSGLNDYNNGLSMAAIKSDGTLWNWGNNIVGELGDDYLSRSRSSPVQAITAANDWQKIVGGGTFAAGIKVDSTLWVWGDNYRGQLGINTSSSNGVGSPIQTLLSGSTWSDVSTGDEYMGAVKSDGTLWMWGYNLNGQLGINLAGFAAGSLAKSSPIQTVAGGTDWSKIACGFAHTLAIKQDNSLWAWGANGYGQLGDNTRVNKSSPVQIGGSWSQVGAGSDFTAAIKPDGTLWTWGRNTSGRLGDNTVAHRSSPVQTVAGGTDWQSLSVSYLSTYALKTDGSLWVWGSNSYGQLGDNTRTHRSSPIQTIFAGTDWQKVNSRGYTVGAIKSGGTLWIWGSNASGQLGIDSTAHRSSPVQIMASKVWADVSAGVKATYFLGSP